MLGVTLALAPSVTDGVAEFDSEALRVGAADTVAVPDGVAETLALEESEGIGAPLTDTSETRDGVAVPVGDAIRLLAIDTD